MKRIRVGVLRGGPSNEYDVSLKTGEAVLRHLSDEKYEPVEIFVDKNGTWHVRGAPIVPQELAGRIDAAFNALHGEYGEDGQIQRELERFGIPYTGSRVTPSATAFHKGHAKKRFAVHEIQTPSYVLLFQTPDIEQSIYDIFRSVVGPYVIKPVRGGSSVGIQLAESFGELREAIHTALGEHPDVLVEQRIQGREATVGVLENFRGETAYALPPVEIIPPDSSQFFDYDAKYSGTTKEICPGNFPRVITEELQELAKRVHKALGLRHYSRTDFMVSPRGIYVLEVNTLPGLTEESLLPKAVTAVGSSFSELLDHLISLALGKK